MEKKTFILVHQVARNGAIDAIRNAPEGWHVTIKPPTRTLEQSAKFHAICVDIAKSGALWAGKTRAAIEWKCLLVSGHAIATKEGSEIVPGLEGEFINLRESTALMSKSRGASLIEYTLAWCASNSIILRGE